MCTPGIPSCHPERPTLYTDSPLLLNFFFSEHHPLRNWSYDRSGSPRSDGAAAVNQPGTALSWASWCEITALANNYDLAAAVTRVEQARQVAAQVRSQCFPNLSCTTYASYGHNQFIYSPSSNLNGAQGAFLAIGRAAWEADL